MPSQKLGIDWPDQRHHRHRIVDRRMRPRGGEDAERDGEHDRKDEGEGGELDGGRQPFGDDFVGRLVADERVAEIALQRVADETRNIARTKVGRSPS